VRPLSLLLSGGGAALVAAAFVGYRKSEATKVATEKAVQQGGAFRAHATGYWPFTAKPSERKMEGAPVDRKGKPLHTVEDFFAGRSDHASASGDDAIFPYGQLLLVDWFGKTLRARVTDVGDHFHGGNKVKRVWGEEPLDFCVESARTPIPKSPLIVRPVVGDHLDKAGKAIATNKMQESVVGLFGLDVFCGVASETRASIGLPVEQVAWMQYRNGIWPPAVQWNSPEEQARFVRRIRAAQAE